MNAADPTPAAPQAKLSLWDATSIIVGIIIGSSIYESTPLIASNVPNVSWLLGIWLFGDVLTVVGSLCYAELANAYPHHGGDYVYLTEAYGRQLGFVFAWMQFWVVRPGSIGAVAYIFASYAFRLLPIDGHGRLAWGLADPSPRALMIYAASSVVLLTVVNVLGIHFGRTAQNLLTAVKYLGLAAVVVVGLCYARPVQQQFIPQGEAASGWPNLPFAMIFILFAYSGWNEIAYVATEVRSPEKNVLRALLLGAFFVAVLYLLAAIAFVHALGLGGVQHSNAVAADVLRLALGKFGDHVISGLICITALGGINGMLFTGARIYYAMGSDHRLYSWLGHWDAQRHAPLRTLTIQAAVTVALIIGFGLSNNSFGNLVIFTGPAFWFFLFLVGAAVMVLRFRHEDRRWFLPLEVSAMLASVFCLTSGYMIYASTHYALVQPAPVQILFWSANGVVLLLGIGLSFIK